MPRPTKNSQSTPILSLDDLSLDSRYIAELVNSKFDEMNEEISNLKELLTTEKKARSELLDKVTALEQKVAKLESSLDDEDAYVRRETLIFNGTDIPPPTAGEICSNIIRDVVKKKLKIVLQPSDISVAHCSGKKPTNQAQDRRGIHVKFCRRDTKREIMMAKKDNSDPQHTLFANECLTPKRRTILYALRQMKKKFPALVKGCTTQDGRVYAFTPSASSSNSASATFHRDRKHLVNSHDSLVTFCREFVKLPLENFLDSWNH